MQVQRQERTNSINYCSYLAVVLGACETEALANGKEIAVHGRVEVAQLVVGNAVGDCNIVAAEDIKLCD